MKTTLQVQQSATARLATLISIAGLTGIFAYLLVYHFHHERKDNEQHLGDFPTFYQAAEFARTHRDIYTAGKPKQKYVYPPLTAVLYVPLTYLPRLTAAHFALVINAAILLAALLLAADTMVRRMDARGKVLPIVVAFGVAILNENEMRLQLTMLETDAVMLLMFVVALRWLDSAPAVAGIALAFAFNIKYLPIVVLPYLILHRRWKVLGAMALGSVFFALIPAVLLGWNEDIRCLHIAFGGLLKWVHAPDAGYAVQVHDIGDPLSLSITSAVARVLVKHGLSNLATMIVSTGIGIVALGAVAAIYRLNGLSLWRSRDREIAATQPGEALVALEWAGLIVVALAFSPDTNARHLLLDVIVNSIAVTLLLMPSTRTSKISVLIAVAIIFFAAIMPGGEQNRGVYFHNGLPSWALLAGYLLILWTGIRTISGSLSPTSTPSSEFTAPRTALRSSA